MTERTNQMTDYYPTIIIEAKILLAQSTHVPADTMWVGCHVSLAPNSTLTVDGKLEYCLVELADEASSVEGIDVDDCHIFVNNSTPNDRGFIRRWLGSLGLRRQEIGATIEASETAMSEIDSDA